jgi:hypothetical protein
MKPQIGGLYKKINYDEYALVLDLARNRVSYVIYSRDTRFNGQEHNTSVESFRDYYAPYAPAT